MRLTRLATVFLFAVGLLACDGARTESADRAAPHEHDASEHAEHAGHPEDNHSHAHDALAPGEISGGSVYNLTGAWWDSRGERAPLTRLAGRPQVVALVYTSCAQACPAIVSELKRIEAALGSDAAHVGFVLASIDPERDTPEKLAEFARRASLDPSRWTLLGAADSDVLELAAVLGVQYRQLPDGEFTHSNVVTVLDARGEIAHRQLGLGQETDATVSATRHLIS